MDELMKALECCAEYLCGECPYQKYNSTDYILKCSHKLIADLAAAGLKPERHGRWIEETNIGEFYNVPCLPFCSVCHNTNQDSEGFGMTTEYCPHCGAKMDLEEEV